jgi:general secretion pathway protein A
MQAQWLPWVAGVAGAVLLAGGTWLVWSRYGAASASPQVAAAAAAPGTADATASDAGNAAAADAPAAGLAPETPELAQLLQQGEAAPGPAGAWSHLFGLWGAQFMPGDEDPCAQALRQGLECLGEDGGLEALRRYNRPAILGLADDAGATRHAVLAQLLDAQRARLMLGDAAYEIPLAEIQARWNGEFLLLWKPPLPEPRNLRLGMAGEPVRSLRARLNAWAGLTEDAAPLPEVFDENLQQLVIRFQAGNGLAIDGVAGARTQALLDAAVAGAGTPLLSAAAH